MELKRCCTCKIEKELENFGKIKGRYRAECSECRKVYHRKYYLAHPEKFQYKRDKTKENYDPYKQRVKTIKSKYGLDIKDFNKMLEDQFNKCFICKEEFTSELKPFIDHNHDTLAVRGLLCSYCNSALGLFKDKIYNIEEALKYLKLNK